MWYQTETGENIPQIHNRAKLVDSLLKKISESKSESYTAHIQDKCSHFILHTQPDEKYQPGAKMKLQPSLELCVAWHYFI